MKSNRALTVSPLIFVLAAAYFAFFHQLDRLTIRVWDEASYALNAQEMIENGNLLVVHEFGRPDLYNTKPPFAIWCMATSIQAFGFNVLGTRMASAVFCLFSVVLLFFAGARILKSPVAGTIAALVLCSSDGFVNWHIGRTGDTDSILAFWVLCSAVCFFLYSESLQSKWLVMCTLSICFGCLTKGVSGLMPVPAFIAWTFISRQHKAIFTARILRICTGLFILLVPGYYLLREMLAPGYLQAVIGNEIGGRLHVQEKINYFGELPFWMYIQDMVTAKRFMPWIFVVPAATLAALLPPPSTAKRMILLLFCTALSVTLILGFSKTKLVWYDAPLYPLFALLIGAGYACVEARWQKWIGPLCAVAALTCFAFPYTQIVQRNIYEEDLFHFPAFFEKARTTHREPLFVADRHMIYPISFYLKRDSLNGYQSRLVTPDAPALNPGDLVITMNRPRADDMERWYEMDILAEENDCRLGRVRLVRK